MPDLPVRALTRSAKMAALPIGHASRAALGVGKRIGGAPAEAVAAELQARTAEQMFRVLGELKGGAMKVGQAMSIFEAALPEDVAAPYRATLTKLQEQAPALPAEKVHAVLVDNFGKQWRRKFQSFDDKPAAAASIGQVHRAVWKDGRPVAVKIQYPGADKALMSDLANASRLARMMTAWVPGVDLKPLLAELAERVKEELDYEKEAASQRAFAKAFRNDPDVVVADVLGAGHTVIISEWLEGTPLSRIIADGTQEERDVAGLHYLRFLLSSPGRAGLLHADPHPGNFRITPDGRFGVLDFGAVAHLPDGFPPMVGNLLRIAMKGDSEAVLAGLREEGFVKTTTKLEAQGLLDFLDPFVDPARTETFLFSREWLRGQFARLNDPRNPDFAIGLKMNLPPDYLLIHRVWLGAIGVMCQLNAEVPMRAELERWVPGFAVAAGGRWADGRSGHRPHPRRGPGRSASADLRAAVLSNGSAPRSLRPDVHELVAVAGPVDEGLPNRGSPATPRSQGPGCRSSRSCRGGSRGCRGGPPRWPGGAPRGPRASRRSARSRRADRAPAPRVPPFAQARREALVGRAGALQAAAEGALPPGDQPGAAHPASLRRPAARRLTRGSRAPLPDQPGGGRAATRRAPGAHGGQEATGLAVPPGPGTGQRPGDHEAILGTRHADVEQPPLLLDPLLGVGVHDRQVALGRPDDEHDRPLEALRGVQGGDGDTVGGRCVRQLGATLELLDQLRHRAAPRGRDLLSQREDRGQGLPALARGTPAGRTARQPTHPGQDGVGLLDQAVGRVPIRGAPGRRTRAPPPRARPGSARTGRGRERVGVAEADLVKSAGRTVEDDPAWPTRAEAGAAGGGRARRSTRRGLAPAAASDCAAFAALPFRRPPPATAWPRMRTIASRTSGRSKNRSAPRMM